jgi:GTP:adenosylcobinamide-phosphate guanylyltransferase
MRVDAILPAGGRLRGAFAERVGTNVKALIRLGGATLLARTLAALRATERVGRIVIVGPRDVLDHPDARRADAVLPEGGDSGPANILRGLEWLHQFGGGADRVLVVTTDLPFLTPRALTNFLDACPANLDICVPVLTRGEFRARFPDFRITCVRLRDGDWTMGCAFLVNPQAIAENRGLIERTFAARKSPLAMARLLGVGFLLRFAARRLTVPEVERRGGELLNCAAGAITGCPPELAFDIDTPQEYEYAAQTLAPGEEAVP